MGWTTMDTWRGEKTRDIISRLYEGDLRHCADCGWGATSHPRSTGSEHAATSLPAPHAFRQPTTFYRVSDYSQVGWTTAYLAVTDFSTGRTHAGVCRFHRTPGSISVKDMDEEAGPVESRCPEHILDRLSPTESDIANAWRERCREYHRARRSRPKVIAGDMVRFASPLNFSDGSSHANFRFVRGSSFKGSNGYGLYRISNWRERRYEVIPAGAEDKLLRV